MSAIDSVTLGPCVLLDDSAVNPTDATFVVRPPLESVQSSDVQADDLTRDVGMDATLAMNRRFTGSSIKEPSKCAGPENVDLSLADRLVGTVIGKFRIEGIIASGGMGTVYKAQQEQPVRRPVALKMIKAGMADQNTLSRFLAERQVLAMMDHSDIARVYEADATSDGNPYLAMEFCDGEPIDEYCERKRLSLHERVELVVRMARAVSRAHAHGVVHRDLKPSNVLIADTEDRPQLKVIDFGIAKWMAEPTGLQVHATQIGEMVGTPAYMSPEQAVGDVDARTDVFAMGAILFKLLTGTTPLLPPATAHLSLAQVIQYVQGFQGLTPTRRFAELSHSDRERLARELQFLKPTHWNAAVQGDLDWITLRAIEPERTRRYATASDFADDLERYLRQEPVEAAAPSRWYRWTKFYQRRKTLLWSLAMIVAAVVLAAAFSGFTWWRYEWQKLNETHRIATEAELLIAESQARHREGSTNPSADDSTFVAARTAAARAETLLMGRPDLVSLNQSLGNLQGQLTMVQRGWELATQLEEAREATTEIGAMEAGDHFGRMAGLREMHAAWERFGITPAQTPAEQAALQIATLPRAIQARIVEALDFLLYEDPFGAGLYLHQHGSRISVAEVVHGGGAERGAQLRKGDRILRIDGVSLLEWSAGDDLRAQAYRLLAGRPGQRIIVTFVRGLAEPVEGEIICGGGPAHWAQEVLAILDPDPWRTPLRLAVLESDLPRLRHLSESANFGQQRPFNLIQLAGTRFMLERTNAALRYLELAQQQHPQNFWANHYLGTALAVAHDPPRPEVGIRYLTSAVALRPNSPGARINLAETLLQLGHDQEAISHFETAQRLSPSHVPVERRLKYLLERAKSAGDLETPSAEGTESTAAEHRESTELQATIEVPEDFEALDALEQQARTLASSGQRREALLLVRRAEDYHLDKAQRELSHATSGRSPESTAMLHRIKGIVLLELQDYVAARVVLADAVRLNPGDAAARFYYGVSLEHSGDSQTAIQEYEAALKIRPDYEAVREFLRNLKQP